jgi:hypothetical protein
MPNVTDKITNTMNFYHNSDTISEDLITMFEETIIAITNVLIVEYETGDICICDELATHKLELEEILSDLRDSYEDQLDAEESLKDYDEMNELINKHL